VRRRHRSLTFIVADPEMCRAPIILALVLILALALSWFCTDRISPFDMTRTAMVETFVRISLYAETNEALPPSLDALPKREEYINRTTDGWKRPLQYSVPPEGVITFRSFGADGKPGVNGENADISQSYRSRKPDGSLWVGSPMWIVDAELK